MAKLYILVAIAAVLCANICLAAQRTRPIRLTQQRTRYLARQAAEADAVTPYPTADELKPEIPFEEAEAPAENVPDSVYGPPTDTTTYNVPDEVYGPPEVTNDLPAAEEPAAEAFPPTLDGEQARLQTLRRANLKRRQAAALRAQRLAKQRAAPRRFA